MKYTGDITLIESSTAGNPDKFFANQTVRIEREPDTIRMSADGIESRGSHPTTVTWYGGTVDALDDITHVSIISKGQVLIDAPVNRNRGRPSAINEGASNGGVLFYVFEGK
jgi:hypothetical protein